MEEWLRIHAVGYGELTLPEKQAIMNFSLLWSLFEAQTLNYSASANSIQSKVNEWNSKGLLKTEEFEKYKEYFTHRYVVGSGLNHRFQHLNFRKYDNQSLVERVLRDETNLISDIVTALLIIVWRYRNNFFHGYKWAYRFEEQLDNFNIANELLMHILEIQWQASENT